MGLLYLVTFYEIFTIVDFEAVGYVNFHVGGHRVDTQIYEVYREILLAKIGYYKGFVLNWFILEELPLAIFLTWILSIPGPIDLKALIRVVTKNVKTYKQR